MSSQAPSIVDHFTLEHIEKYPYIFGENDNFLKYLEKELNTIVSFRGEAFAIEGDNLKNVSIMKNILLAIYKKARLKKNIALIDIKEELQQIRERDTLNDHLPKTLTISKEKVLHFKTRKQQEYIDNIKNNTINFGVGAAGTGKTYLAIAYAMSELYKGSIKKIILTRPVVEAGENLGFLPGTLEDKIAPYLKPIVDALESFISGVELQQLLQKNIIEVIPLAYMRGRSLNNALVILDEAQNTTYLQMKMFLTRLGAYSTMIITGDTSQKDLPHHCPSGLNIAIDIFGKTKNMSQTYFSKEDSVRHPIVKKIIESFEIYEQKRNEYV